MKRVTILLLVLGMLAGFAAPSDAISATEARRQREQVQKQKAAAASKLNALRATDAEMKTALADMDTHLRISEAKAAAARQAADAAAAELETARAELERTKAEIATLEQAVVDRAVEAYLTPRTHAWDDVMDARNLGEIAQRQVLLDSVARSDVDVLDQLDAAREDQVEQEQQLTALDAKAKERNSEAQSALEEARQAKAAQAALVAENEKRIAGQKAEVEALAAQDSNLAGIIRQAEAAARYSNTGGPSAAGLVWPVRGPVTSSYGPRWGRMHHGIDVGAGSGTPIAAAKDGLVIYSGWMNGYGNVVVIDHGGGFTTVYAHQSRIAAGDGATVDRGQTIGYVGSTGRSTGPHLHFETRVNGNSRNPLNYLP